jgi:hypothetical protein
MGGGFITEEIVGISVRDMERKVRFTISGNYKRYTR